MIYTIEKANLITEQLKRFTNGYAHYVAGQFANLDFWFNEVQESIKVIDEYHKRFSNIRDEQKQWLEAHGPVVYNYCPICEGRCELDDGNPAFSERPVRASSTELKAARKELVDSAYFFLLRCYRMRLLDKNILETKCAAIGTSIEPSDLKK
ncbi:MAG: hypothetical protein ABIS01_05245 [Ferruginibacter sp.]